MTAPAPHEHHWDRYAAVAAAIRDGRIAGYPALVEAGKLDADEADRRIAISTACAEIWRAAWACTLPDPMLLGPPGGERFDRTDIIAELLRAREITARRLARDPSNGAAAHQIACIDAMIDWHRRFADGPLFCVRLTLQLRAAAAQPQKKAA